MREIIDVQAVDNYCLLLTFDNGEKRLKDMQPYLNKGVFAALKDESLFKSVRVSLGTIAWTDKIDMCPDALYLSSIPIRTNK